MKNDDDDEAQEMRWGWRWVGSIPSEEIMNENENILFPTNRDETDDILTDQDDGSLLSKIP